MRLLRFFAEQFWLLGGLIYFFTLKLFLTIARDLLGGIIAIGLTRSVMIFLISMMMVVWYLTILALR